MTRITLALTTILSLAFTPLTAQDFDKGLAAAQTGDFVTAFQCCGRSPLSGPWSRSQQSECPDVCNANKPLTRRGWSQLTQMSLMNLARSIKEQNPQWLKVNAFKI